MTTNEFYELTGIRMMNGSTLWWFITEMYNNFPSDKIGFCASIMRRHKKEDIIRITEKLDAYVEDAIKKATALSKDKLIIAMRKASELDSRCSALEFENDQLRRRIQEQEKKLQEIRSIME